LNGGSSTNSVALEILTNSTQGKEYDNDLVVASYEQFYHRAPGSSDAAQVTSFVNMLQSGVHDEQIIAAIIGSQEYFAHL
jgi:hypothetical protein